MLLGDLLLGGAKEDDYGGRFIENGKKFVSLNRFLISNELQRFDDGHNDVRRLARNPYLFKASPLPDSVARVIEVGGGD